MTTELHDDLLLSAMSLFKEEKYFEAFEIFKSFAFKGDALAQHMAGLCFYYGNGTAVNKAQALFWFHEAAQQLFSKSELFAGLIHLKGEGTEVDLNKAIYYLTKAADAGEAYACRILAEKYSSEISDELTGIDMISACKYFEKGASLGDPYCMERLAYYLSNDTNGVPNDLERSLKLNLEAATLGNYDAAFNAGLAYVNGSGTKENVEQAFRWYKLAAAAGNVLAQHNLAALYVNSDKNKDMIEAHYWYLKAAEKGSYLSQNCLGNMYQFGQGVEKNLVTALSWHLLAANDGKSADSAEIAKVLSHLLNEAEINRAQEKSEDFQKQIKNKLHF